MDDAFITAMNAARFNQYSWIMPLGLLVGAVVIIASARIQSIILRVVFMFLTTIAMLVVAVSGSDLAIREKWRLRHRWADNNVEILTDSQQQYLNADGANLVMGPILIGGFWAFLVIGISMLLFALLRMTTFTLDDVSAEG